MDFFRNFVFNIHRISESSFIKFNKLIQHKKLLRNQELVHLGQIPTNFYILRKGIIRAYIIDEKGKSTPKQYTLL